MADIERPLSPHLQIYKPQVTSIMSILQRLSGVALFFGLLVLSWGIYAIAQQESERFFAFASSLIGQVFFFGIAWAFIYHLMNGFRYLVWSTGICIRMVSVKASGMVLFPMSLIVTALLWFY